jgi:hypothetical protein
MFDRILSLAIRLASATVLLGWGLSAIGALNLRGYLLAGIPVVCLIGFFFRRNSKTATDAPRFPRLIFLRKKHRLLPAIYLFTFFLIVCGSILIEPNNYDGLSYRIPKILYWTTQNHWQWVNTPFGAINYTLPNYEWLTAPIFLITGGFHATVVINWIAFLFLPPLFFSLLRCFGTSRQLAYDWMWIFPTAYLIAMQAGSIGNDLLGLTAILAALHCANRFAATAQNEYLVDALLATGLCTGVKISNLPLGVFVLIILCKGLDFSRAKRPVIAIAVTLSLCVSAAIPLCLNFVYSGTILGTALNTDQVQNPLAGCLGNGLMTFVSAFAPPVFPGANHVGTMLEHLLGNGLDSWLHAHYAKFTLRLNELPQEDFSGELGLGISLALFLTIVLGMKGGGAHTFPAKQIGLLRWQKTVWWSWLAFSVLVISSKLGTGPSFPRNIMPWIPLLLAPMIAYYGNPRISRSLIWRYLTPLISLSVVPVLLASPSRPLLPPATLFRLAEKSGASTATLDRLSLVYRVYAQRADAFAIVKKELPESVRVLGLVSDGNEPTASWWRPYGSRRCVYLRTEAEVDAARRDGLQYIVLKETSCQHYFNMDTEHWLASHQARPVMTADIKLLASVPPFHYTLAKFDPIPPPNNHLP